MSLQTWHETLIVALSDGAALANSVVATSLLPAHAKARLPANYLQVGRRLRVRAHGRISNIVTTPGTLTLDVRLGAVIAANGGAMALNIVAKTNVPWWFEMDLTCRSIGSGSSATLFPQGLWCSESVIGSPLPSVGGVGSHMLPNAAPAVGTGFDSTVENIVDFFGTWSVANAGNSIQVHGYSLESLN